MIKKLLIFAIIFGVFLVSYILIKKPEKTIKIGMILPMQHTAMDDIKRGFENELKVQLKDLKFELLAQNAMGDINIQRSIIFNFLHSKVDLLVPVGKSTSQMVIRLSPKEQKVLFLAANIEKDSQESMEKPGLMGIIDQIPILIQVRFIKKALSELKKITIIFSSNEKVFDEVNDFIKEANIEGISVQKLMVQNLSELYTVIKHIDVDSQGVFILKDHLVVSGINALVEQTSRLKIPLITSDEGSFKHGATFAIGVIESDIGLQGARLAAKFIKKQDLDKLDIEKLSEISVFVNKSSCEKYGISLFKLKNAASLLGLSLKDG